MNVGLICIATGLVYQQYARKLHKSAHQFFPSAEFVLFSDMEHNPGADVFFRIQGKGYPLETLMRYHTILKEAQALSVLYDQIFYVDADMEFVSAPGDIYSPGIVATLHPGFVGKRGTTETRRDPVTHVALSTAWCDYNTHYFCGGFQGGSTKAYLQAAKVMAERIDTDYRNGITAVWHDESHWNRYLADHKHAADLKILTPSYCYPEDYDGGYGWAKEQYPPILVALDKRKRGNHPRFQSLSVEGFS